jgi:hypothetical protein
LPKVSYGCGLEVNERKFFKNPGDSRCNKIEKKIELIHFLKPANTHNMNRTFGHQRCPLSLKAPVKWPMLGIRAMTNQEPDIPSSVFLPDFFSFRNLFKLLTRKVTRLGPRAIWETIERQSPNIKPMHESFEDAHFDEIVKSQKYPLSLDGRGSG